MHKSFILFNSKRNKNLGFSLVELIVVIAIMAVLVGALAPVLIRNIDKSNEGVDIKAIEEVRQAVVTAIASKDSYTECVPSSNSDPDTVIILPKGSDITDGVTQTHLAKELKAMVPQGFTFKSNALRDVPSITITIKSDATVKAEPTGTGITSNFENSFVIE